MIRYQASLVFLLVYTLLFDCVPTIHADTFELNNSSANNQTSNVSSIQTFCNTTAFTSMDEGFKNRTFIVSAYHCPPFVIFDPAKETFEGLTVDVLNILEPILQAKFKLVINKNDTESIDMALKAVNDGDADFAVGALRITKNRTKLYTFTLPYYDTGYQLIIAMPDILPNLWQFFTPFSNTLWTGVVLEMFIVAIGWYLMEMPSISVVQATDVVPGWVLGLLDAFYWSITVLLQITDKSPRTWGAKMLMMAHGWFMLIVVASYTATLASFLTTAQLAASISGWSDITASQGAYKLALPAGGATMDFINNERLMQNYVFNITWTSSWAEAFGLVMERKVEATLHDEALAQYYLQDVNIDKCHLVEVGKTFNSFGYGFAFPVGSLDFVAFSQGFVYLKQKGSIRELQRKYKIGSDFSSLTQCRMPEPSRDSLQLSSMMGLIWMTVVACAVGIIVNAVERCYNRKTQQEKGRGMHKGIGVSSLANLFKSRMQQEAQVVVPKTKFQRRRMKNQMRLGMSTDIKLPASKLSYALCDGIRDGFVDFMQNLAKSRGDLNEAPNRRSERAKPEEARLETAAAEEVRQVNGGYSEPTAEEPQETIAVDLSVHEAADGRGSGHELPQGANLMQKLGANSMTLEQTEEKRDSLLASIIPSSMMPWIQIGDSNQKDASSPDRTYMQSLKRFL